MPSEIAIAIACAGAFVGLVGGGVALFNSWKAVCWKRAEFANTCLKDFDNDPELVFAGRCLDWNGGKLLLPESLWPYMADGTHFIQHDRRVFARALRPDLQVDEIDEGSANSDLQNFHRYVSFMAVSRCQRAGPKTVPCG